MSEYSISDFAGEAQYCQPNSLRRPVEVCLDWATDVLADEEAENETGAIADRAIDESVDLAMVVDGAYVRFLSCRVLGCAAACKLIVRKHGQANVNIYEVKSRTSPGGKRNLNGCARKKQ
jgi:hypothetical protein